MHCTGQSLLLRGPSQNMSIVVYHTLDFCEYEYRRVPHLTSVTVLLGFFLSTCRMPLLLPGWNGHYLPKILTSFGKSKSNEPMQTLIILARSN